jgi:hypothetical protein
MRSYAQLAGLSVVMGPAQACVGSVAASALVLRLFRRHRALAIGILNGGDNVLNAGVPRASVGLLESFGWRPAVAAMGSVYLLLAVLVRFALTDTDGQAARETSGGVRRQTLPWDDSRWWAIVVAYAAIYAWVTSLQLHFHAYQTDLGRSPALAAELLSTQILVGAIGAPLAGLAAAHTSARFVRRRHGRTGHRRGHGVERPRALGAARLGGRLRTGERRGGGPARAGPRVLLRRAHWQPAGGAMFFVWALLANQFTPGRSTTTAPTSWRRPTRR